MFLSNLLKKLFAFALPMYIMDGGGGGGGQSDQPLNTDSFAEMLGGDGDNEQPEQSDSQSADEGQEAAEETAQEGGDEGDQESADEAADDEQAEQPEKDSAEAFLELEINGEKVQVSKDEAKNGYLRQQDYTQKAQRLAQERQEWNQHVARQAAEVQQYSQEIGQLQSIDAALAEYAQVDWDALRESDPVSYGIHMADYNRTQARRGEVERGIVQKQQSLTAAQQQAVVQQSQEAAAHMATLVPGFGKEHAAEMRAHGLSKGYTEAELANFADKRGLEILWEAAQYRKQQSTTQKAIKAVSALPTKAAKSAPAAKPAAQLNVEKQTRRLQQTGSVKDLAALLSMTS